MFDVKKKVNLFITPDLFKKFVLNLPFEPNEIICDPSQLQDIGDLKFDMPWSKAHFEKLIKGKTALYDTGQHIIHWDLVNCTPDDRIRLIHLIDQNLMRKKKT